uniref:Uncharacterized protein n=1 Tax=Wuchereria bancrofti TaxID=6293 RepID=A0AAF5PWK2_WUCBA
MFNYTCRKQRHAQLYLQKRTPCSILLASLRTKLMLCLPAKKIFRIGSVRNQQ